MQEGPAGAPAPLTYGLIADYEHVMRVDEPQPGSVITETDQGSSLVTTFTVTPAGDGCVVRIESAWNGGGFFERTFAPRVMRKMYADELTRLDADART